MLDPASIDVEEAGTVLLDGLGDGARERPTSEQDRLLCWLKRGAAAFATVQALREAGPVAPHQRIADLEAGILNRARNTVEGTGATERGEVSAWLEHA